MTAPPRPPQHQYVSQAGILPHISTCRECGVTKYTVGAVPQFRRPWPATELLYEEPPCTLPQTAKEPGK